MSYTDPEPPPQMIPQCRYLKRKGATVSSLDDLLAWSEALAEHPELYEPFTGKLPQADMRNRREVVVESRPSPRIELILEGMELLDKKDFTPTGPPSIESLRRVVDDNVTLDERNEAWHVFQKQQAAAKKK